MSRCAKASVVKSTHNKGINHKCTSEGIPWKWHLLNPRDAEAEADCEINARLTASAKERVCNTEAASV